MCMQVLNLQTYSSIQVSHIKVLFCFVFDSFPMWHYRILIEFPVLCSFPLLGIYFIYSSVFMSSPFMCVCSVISDSLRPHRLQLTRLLCLQDFPGKSTGVGCHFHLQGIFPTQRSNPHLLHLPALSGGFFFFFLTTGAAVLSLAAPRSPYALVTVSLFCTSVTLLLFCI